VAPRVDEDVARERGECYHLNVATRQQARDGYPDSDRIPGSRHPVPTPSPPAWPSRYLYLGRRPDVRLALNFGLPAGSARGGQPTLKAHGKLWVRWSPHEDAQGSRCLEEPEVLIEGRTGPEDDFGAA
jgi:hypothetical protein